MVVISHGSEGEKSNIDLVWIANESIDATIRLSVQRAAIYHISSAIGLLDCMLIVFFFRHASFISKYLPPIKYAAGTGGASDFNREAKNATCVFLLFAICLFSTALRECEAHEKQRHTS